MTDSTIQKRALIRFGRTLLFSVVATGLVLLVDLIPQLQLDDTLTALLVAIVTATIAAIDKFKRDNVTL